MQDNVSVTGERLTLGHSSKRNQEDHVGRYEYAAKYAGDAVILDVACGTGYGVQFLCNSGAKRIVGVDIDKKSIDFAHENHSHPNASFVCASAAKLDFEDGTFDLVVTFETIEHLEDDDRRDYLKEIHRVLKPDGLVILSTPNKMITSPWSRKPLNPYHVLEFYKEDLQGELDSAGFVVSWWGGQRYVRNIFTKRLTYLATRLVEKIMKKSLGVYEIADGPIVKKFLKGKHPRYFVVELKKK